MFSYLKKFNELPKELREKVSGPTALTVINELENKYGVELAAMIMRVMVKEVPFKELGLTLASEIGVRQEVAENIVRDLKDKIFYSVTDYLGIIEPVVNQEDVMKNLALNIIDISGLKINKDLRERLAKVLGLYLRGVRNKIDTRDLLKRSVKDGGFALDDNSAEKLINLADSKNPNIVKPTVASVKPTPSVMDKINSLSARPYEAYDLKKSLDTAHELAAGVDLSHEISAPKKMAPLTSPSLPTRAPTEVYTPRPMPPLEPTSAKTRVDDIRSVKIMNPIDELRYMDLINFRRLANEPYEMTKKIKARVDYLESEDFEKKLAGVAAWRQSPVNKLYLKIVGATLSQGVPIAAVIADLQSKRQESLTPEEFDAIVDLNNELKF